ncbi:alpha-amylase family protein [Flavicella sediminum]|uniref:hypothetical protein n=1 Tax=Flavicella sediminum TaxID=2585141 RepID=UPI00111D0BF8|nr:hypothetical protein [Flavicella sediminum]
MEEEEVPEEPLTEFAIISESNPRITTHHLTSGSSGFQLGITSNAGGVINEIIIPGIGDIMTEEADLYGRAGQVAIRDSSHGGRYNPTQAGFNETLGSKCAITQTPNKLVVEPRPMALWHGDGQYDFTRWENIGADPYKTDGGNTDEDGLDEEDLPGKQLDEVRSEFDYYGTYEDISGKNGIDIAIIRHYYQISFIRPPGHCINQHRAGTKLWNPQPVQSDISVKNPAGVHPGSDKDLNRMTSVWSLRHDRAKWTPKYTYYRKTNGAWATLIMDNVGKIDGEEDFPSGDNTIFINADSNIETQGKALAIYRPKTDINTNTIIGVNETNGSIVYKDKRTTTQKIQYSPKRIQTMSKYGFVDLLRGMINRTQLDGNTYEAFRNEVYILYGTPKEIMDAIAILDVSLGV